MVLGSGQVVSSEELLVFAVLQAQVAYHISVTKCFTQRRSKLKALNIKHCLLLLN